jgi:hypothetical protein
MRQQSFAWWLGASLGATLVSGIVGCPGPLSIAATDVQTSSRQPVLVELFTSLGCSSCPPADVLLAKLDEMQPVPGAKIIVLSEHVTYWDHQGWRDPYSLDSVTDRQRWYGDKFGLKEVYTPQALVDGEVQMLGTDADNLVKAVSAAAAEPKQDITIADAAWSGDGVKFSVHNSETTTGKSKLVAALAEDQTLTSVKKGENAGKTLSNVAVVRVLKEIGAGSNGDLTLKIPSGPEKNPVGPVRLVVFLVDKHSGHVLGAAEQSIAR